MGMVLMVIGIGAMAAFISQVSASLVESRLKGSQDRENLRNAMASEVKDRINHLDRLTDSELALLMKMIQALREAKTD